MKDEILTHLDDPAGLEKLYRTDKPAFKRSFNALYAEIKENILAVYWNERLNYPGGEIFLGTRNELVFILIASFLAGLIARLPIFFSINEDFFYPRNIGFVVFPALSAYFAWKNKLSAGQVAFIGGATIAGVIFINTLPDVKQSDTLILSCIHLLLFLWSLLGFAFVGGIKNGAEKRLAYLKYNGDLIVMTTLILIAGAIMTGITIGLFSLIGFDIREFYVQNVAVFGLAAAPLVGTYLTRTNPQLVGKVSPVIARLFSPLVLVMLVIYLAAMIYSRKDPYNDREFLLIFNALLVGVMAIIFFSVAEISATTRTRAEIWILFLLSAITVVLNGVALSAIIFRIAEFGITPNRSAVLGSNVLILVNLAMVSYQLFRAVSGKGRLDAAGKAIALYLPVYSLWAIIVTFLFPVLFGFR